MVRDMWPRILTFGIGFPRRRSVLDRAPPTLRVAALDDLGLLWLNLVGLPGRPPRPHRPSLVTTGLLAVSVGVAVLGLWAAMACWQLAIPVARVLLARRRSAAP